MSGYQNDAILRSSVDSFIKEYNLEHIEPLNERFEFFANYCVVARLISNNFDPVKVSVGKGREARDVDTAGIDGIAIIVNDHLVTSEAEADDLIAKYDSIKIDFIFIQAKNYNGFESKEIAYLGHTVSDFFSRGTNSHSSSSISKQAKHLAKLKTYILRNASSKLSADPTCHMYFVTTGRLQLDNNLKSAINACDLSVAHNPNLDTNFSQVKCNLIGARELSELCRGLNRIVVAEIEFTEHAILPSIGAPREGGVAGFIGTITAKNFLELITYAGDNSLRRNLFNENVRAYQGDNEVNAGIAHTIKTKPEQFVLLNNGITIVAKSIDLIGSKRYKITDYQIVNGCQTSHVLYLNKKHVKQPNDLHLLIKLFYTTDREISSRIVEGTNSQTEIDRTAFEASLPFHRELEDFYNTRDLRYERRSKQYENYNSETDKFELEDGLTLDRIVTIEDQARYFIGMFLEKPHETHKPYHTLLKDYKGKLFVEGHLREPYYISSYTHYVLQKFFIDGSIDASLYPFRYHIMMLFRIQVTGGLRLGLDDDRIIKEYCAPLEGILSDEKKALEEFKRITDSLSEAWNNSGFSSDEAIRQRDFINSIIESPSAVGVKGTPSKIGIGAYKKGDNVTGQVVLIKSYGALLELPNKMKGLVHINNLSWLKTDQVEDILKLGDEVEVRILEIDREKRRIELSLKELQPNPWYDDIPEKYSIGEIVRGKIVDITHFGAYAELEPGLNGLIRTADLAQDFVKDPNEIVSVGTELDLKVIKLDPVAQRINLSLKAARSIEPNQWLDEISKKYGINSEVRGKIVRVENFGAFAELEPGLNGLIHRTELSHEWFEHVNRIVSVDDELDLMVIDLDPIKQHIGLSLKAMQPTRSSKWHDGIPEKYPIGSVVHGKIVTVTPFGAFAELEDAPDGLIHKDELAEKRVMLPGEVVSVGDELDLKVIRLDARKGRINLSLKAMKDPWYNDILEKYPIDSVVHGKIVNITHFGAFAELEPGVTGLIHRTELSDNRFNHPNEIVSVGDELDLKVIDLAPIKRRINLSLKAIDSTRSNPWTNVPDKYLKGKTVRGKIVRVETFGAFAELEPRVTGLIHRTELSDNRFNHPNEIVSVGDELDLEVIDLAPTKKQISLSLKAVSVEHQATQPVP